MNPTAAQLAALTGLTRVFRYGTLRSTNSRAAAIAAQKKLPGSWAVLATRQTAGRGRGANQWFSGSGSLTATFALPAHEERSPGELTLRSGLAVRRALSQYIDADRLTIKWPNDVLADGKKLCGILCERVGQTDLVGVGVNIAGDFTMAPAEVKRRATSLATLIGKPRRENPTAIDVFIGVALALRDVWESGDWHAELSRVHALTGKRIGVSVPGGDVLRGVCTGIDRAGRLLLEEGGTIHRIDAGSVVEQA
ncbi:MAG: biotin--[acetyl-CoA-carboxylase] ligase [Planctomycetes bacterium]|nr:biotin--[acetyl-CoA-carboxylase] ligase [Planctomycetota bacterium]